MVRGQTIKLRLGQKSVRSRLVAACAALLTVMAQPTCLLGQHENGETNTADSAAKTHIFLPPAEAEHRLAVKVPIDYPPAARRGHMEGPVTVRVLVDREGKVKKMTPMTGNPLLLLAAMDAIGKWRYRPYKVNGQLVEFESDVNFRFVL